MYKLINYSFYKYLKQCPFDKPLDKLGDHSGTDEPTGR